jgi:hypothetical protein
MQEDRFERFAMQAEQMARESPGGQIEIEAVGKALHFTREDSFELARYLGEIGWARIHDPWLTLALLGYREIRNLRGPRWQRLLRAHALTVIIAAISAVVGTVITILVTKLIGR